MEEVPRKVPSPFVYKAVERRGIRSLVQLIFERSEEHTSELQSR